MADRIIQRFLDNIALQNGRSAQVVGYFLNDFEAFIKEHMKSTPSDLIKGLKEGTATDDPKEEQPYIILQKYAAWLKKNRLDTNTNNARTVKYKLYWARTLMDTNFIPISNALYKRLIKTEKPEDPDLSPVDKNTVRNVITSLEDLRLQSFAMWCASMGWRATESLSIRNLNLEGLNLNTLKFDTLPAFITMSGKTAKTRKGKRRQLTAEMARQIERYLAWKYRPRQINRKVNGRWQKEHVEPKAKPTDRLFTPLWTGDNSRIAGEEAKLVNVYERTAEAFREAMDRIGIGFEENGKRHKVTLHTLRRYCFTTCSRTNGESYAKYHIGRKIHEYDKRTPEQIAEDFSKVEPFLTLMDTASIEKQQAALTQQLQEERERSALIIRYIMSKDPKEKAEISRELIALGYMPKG